MRCFEYSHVVGFEETNLVGNVYYVNHLRWQGRAREMFLREHAPEILQDLLEKRLALVTIRCSCEYFAELNALDQVVIRMRLAALTRHQISMVFEYWRGNGADELLVARGEQEVACMRRDATGLAPSSIPDRLREALLLYLEALPREAAMHA